MRVLLESALKNIKSLKVFFDTFTEHILSESKNGCKKYHWGFIVDQYLTLYAHKDELSETDTQLLKKYESILGDSFSVDSVEKLDENRVAYKFTIHSREELLSQGIEIDIKKAANQFPIFYNMAEIHFSNTLIMLITKFEEFIAEYFRVLFSMYPEKYLNNEKILYSDIQKHGVRQIQDAVLNKVIDETMRDKYTTWFHKMEEHKMKFDSFKEELSVLNEIYERRNIIVHNFGIVNEIYLRNVPNSKAKLGEKLYVKTSYVKNAFNIINCFIFKILIESLRLFKETEQEQLCDAIFSFAFNELCDENYIVCSKVFSELINSKYCSSLNKAMSQINYWIAKIELDGLESVQDDLQKYDVSVLDKKYVLAKHILLCDYNQATILLDRLLKTEEFPIDAVKEWPLFKRYRDSDQYQQLILMNKELFENESYETQNPPESDTAGGICDDLCENNDYNPQEQTQNEVHAEQIV